MPLDMCKIEAVREMLLQDRENGQELLLELQGKGETLLTIHRDKALVGLMELAQGNSAYVTVFVAPAYRRLGIGTEAVLYAERILRTRSAKEIVTSYVETNLASAAFAEKHKYTRQFSSAYMERESVPFQLEPLPVRLYADEDYAESHALYARAFHEMRLRVGDFPDSTEEPPSEESRAAWKEMACDRYVYKVNCQRLKADGELTLEAGVIAGYAHVEGNEISSVSIRSDLQGRGLGKKFVMYLCNELCRRGHDRAALWCVVKNNARYLYESLGFKETYTAAFAKKIHTTP